MALGVGQCASSAKIHAKKGRKRVVPKTPKNFRQKICSPVDNLNVRERDAPISDVVDRFWMIRHADHCLNARRSAYAPPPDTPQSIALDPAEARSRRGTVPLALDT